MKTLRRSAAVLAVTALTALAAAQTAPARPPQPSSTEKPPIVLTYLLAVVVATLVVAGNLIPSKRGHQD